jgi:hypothetical protein
MKTDKIDFIQWRRDGTQQYLCYAYIDYGRTLFRSRTHVTDDRAAANSEKEKLKNELIASFPNK